MRKNQDFYDAESQPLPFVRNRSPQKVATRSKFCYSLALWLVISLAISLAGIELLHSSPPRRFTYGQFPPDGPGLGLALSTHGGTVAIRYVNGGTENVIRINASQEYINIMRRLDLPSSQHPAPPYDSIGDSFSDRPRQWYRALRKRLGLPASYDVGIIAGLLRDMVEAAQAHLPPSHPALTSALTVIPNVIAIYPEDVQDALVYLGLVELWGHNISRIPRALPAAYAGYGLGLCEHPEDFERCVEEERNMKDRGVVIVDAEVNSLATDSRGMDTPMYVFNEYYALLDWEVWDHEENDTSSQHRDWIAGDINHGIWGLERRNTRAPGVKFVDDVLMAGSRGGDKMLRDMVRDVVAKYQVEEAVIHSEDPEWVLARGAAELARRSLIQKGRIM